MNEQEIIKRLRQNRRNINFINTNCDPPEWIKKALRTINKRTLSYIIDYIKTPEEGIIIDNPKPDWMPKMICTIVDLPFNVGRDYSWEELEQVIIELSLAGCDGIRIFGTGWEPFIEPFLKTPEGKYSFFKPNPAWDETLIQFAELLHKYHMVLYVDLYDNCSHKAEWNPFANNIHGFSHYFYGHIKIILTPEIVPETNEPVYMNEVDFMIKHWDNRILACLDPDKDIVGLGNELRCQVESSAIKCRTWAEKWGVPRAQNIFAQGFSAPIPFSGANNTAQKLFGYISAEVHPELGWTYRTSCKQIHGLGTPERVANWKEGGPSQRRVFSYDDDGVGTNPDSRVPENQRGHCEIRRDGKETACTADTATRVETVRAFIDALKNLSYCFSIGFLPRSILYKGKTVLSRFDKEADAAIYWRVAQDLWGVDIRRNWSK